MASLHDARARRRSICSAEDALGVAGSTEELEAVKASAALQGINTNLGNQQMKPPTNEKISVSIPVPSSKKDAVPKLLFFCHAS